MQIKQYDKQGVIAWSNSKVHSELLASASFQEDNGLYHLDILSLDLQDRSRRINVIGNGYADSPFRCIAWDNFGEKENLYSHGLIFSGMQDHSFKLWNPSEMIATYQDRPSPSLENIDTQEGCIIYQEELDNEFPVMCAEWNSLNNNILAFGTTDVFIVIVDKDPTNPDLRKPGKKNPHHGSYVTSVSWNREVAHILASASENGLVALWDIKTNNSIFQFRDSGASTTGSRNVQICWSKSISTQIAVTLDDEKHNELQIWDLRNQKGPVVVIDKCHTKGINAMDWCETDPELILTASRDKKIACWNYTQEEEPINQTQLDSQTVKVKWSKKLPSIYSVSTEEKTFIYTLSDANLFSYVPKWYKVPVGSSIFGMDSVLTYSELQGNILQQTNILDQNRKSPLRQKLKEIAHITQHKQQEQQTSQLSNLLKAKNGQGDTDIYDYLGFNKSKIVQEVQKYTGKKREFVASNQKEKSTKHKSKHTKIQGQDALAFFASINNKSFEENTPIDQDENNQRVQYDMIARNSNWDLGKEKIVKQNILIGNYEGAIDAAMKCGRMAEALIIAYSVDQNLFNNTLKTFFTQTTDSFITDVLKPIAYKDALELVKKYDLNKWKQCIALIFSISGKDKRPQLLKLLAQRLRTESLDAEAQDTDQIIAEAYPAIICCILAEDFNQIVNIYSENLKLFESGSVQRKFAAIQYAKRLILIFQHLTVQITDLKLFQKIVREVAFISLEEQEKVLAHHLLSTYTQNSQKTIDYLTTTSKQLQKYKTSIKYKSILLPVMQAKKVQKKTVAKGGQLNKQATKTKAKIFEKQDEVKPPPPPVVTSKKKIQQNSEGFSPYENNPKPVQLAQKKNLNTPPPMPVLPKKNPIAPVVQIESEPKKEVPLNSGMKAPTNSSVKRQQPPPPPPPANQAHNTSNVQDRQSEYNVPQRGPSKQPPSVPTEKKHPQPPAFQKSVPPPLPKGVLPPPQKYEEQVEEQSPKIKQHPQPPPKQNFPPQKAAKVEEPQREQQIPKNKNVVSPPPPLQIKSKGSNPPQMRVEQKRNNQPQQEEHQPVIKRIAQPPPPQVKRVIPPPMRK